ncbi:MAG: alpha-mannosidase [Lentisphaeria bacterium]|nr:alpha-mannosidase [Lentisphaeria bacterium]
MLKEEWKIYENRCKYFLGRLGNDYYDDYIQITGKYSNYGSELLPFKEKDTLTYSEISEGGIWGHAWESAYFHFEHEIPADWADKELVFLLNLTGEILVFDNFGVPYCGLTGTCAMHADYHKEMLFVEPWMVKDGKLNLWCEASANHLFGVRLAGDPNRREAKKVKGSLNGDVQKMRLCLFNRAVWELKNDFEILWNLFQSFPEMGHQSKQLLHAMTQAINAYSDNPDNADKARAVLREYCDKHSAASSALTIAGVGHAHIDVGWLWPVRESVRKAARTFASQLELIRRYPNYVFGASQPQLYQFIKDHYPELYSQVKAAVKSGNWELQGGMWVEADCNIIGGESMVRQFIHGKNFYMDEFGEDIKNLWLPDVFGYSAALPQIIKKAGCDYFLTQKISWNQYNVFPHHTFIWRGIDGSEVLTHFPPENNYNADVLPVAQNQAQDRFAEAGFLDEFVSLFGIGDGGGGPAMHHLERAERLQNLDGVPKFKYSKTADFFERLAAKNPKLAKWDGELYLEMHRGTLTTQALTKRNNRRIEQLLAATEFMLSMLPLDKYPIDVLDKCWKKLLINQFHDIIPGSSIREVYDVTEKEHAEVIATLEKLLHETALEVSEADENSALVVNTLSDVWSGVVELPETWAAYQVLDENGKVLPSESADGKVKVLLEVAPNAVTTLTKGEKISVAEALVSNEKVLENNLIRYTFNDLGEVISAYDKEENRELITDKAGNVVTLYTDRPNVYDAWDVDVFYQEEESFRPSAVEVSAVSVGMVESTMQIAMKIGVSELKQTVKLRKNSKRLDFVTEVDWQECRKMLRVKFGANIEASEGAYEIQYGFVKRPVHENTSWDKAKFEVVSHRYFDLSERNYGVAMLNDCKYGCKARRGELDLCLLRSPLYPDANADRGKNIFTYSYLPHTGSLVESCVMAEAASLNRQVIVADGRKAKMAAPVVLESSKVSLEVVKRAEKSNKLVLRLVERAGENSTAVLNINNKVKSFVETNLLEWTKGRSYKVENGKVELTLKPFEILTLIED